MHHDQERAPREPEETGITISCEDCSRQSTAACNGCLVSFILDRSPGDAVVFDVEEARALRVLNGAGLVPRSRFEAAS